MKTCRLKIITSNIINDIDIPKIHYVSQNKKVQFKPNIENINQSNTNEKILEQLEEKIENHPEEKKFVNQIKLEELIKYDFINTTDNIEINDKKEENKEENKIDIIEKKEEEIEKNNIDINNINEKKVENKEENKEENKGENNIDINDLCTISNQHLYEEDKNNNSINNNNNISNFYNNTSYSNNYPYTIENKKREINTKLRTIFKNREKKNPFMNRSLSYMNNKNKKSLIKSIVSKNANINKIKNNDKNKKGNILNININKSFCFNNNSNNMSNNTSSKNNKLKSRNRSINNQNNLRTNSKNSNNSNFSKNTKNSKGTKNSNIKIKIKNVKPLNIKRLDLEESHSSYVSWNVIEKKDFNIEQDLDYKLLIDDLLAKECQIIKEKENIIQIYEQKLKPIREINKKLMDENNEELDRQDELKGELIVLKNQYENLFSLLNSDNINNNIFDQYNDLNNTEDNYQEEFNNKIQVIEEENKKLNEYLKNGNILLITKPFKLIIISEQENRNITLMLKGIFMSRHFFDTDKIVDLIWKHDKKLQTIYFLVEEFLNYFNLDPNTEKDILLNYFYSFCKNYNYMNINIFKNEFKKKIGNIQIYNKYVYFSILLNYHRSKINQLLQILKDKDVFNLGIIKYDIFIKSLLDVGLYLDKDHSENSEEILEFLIFCMKKDYSLELSKNKNKKKDDIKYSLFDLYYESLNDLIDEHDSNLIKNPFKLIRNYMKKNDINNAEYILKPLLNTKFIIKINNVQYIDITIMNKYLRKIGIIQKDEKILVDLFEEELIDRNKFIDNIYDSNINTKEERNPEKTKQNANNLIDDILNNFK